MSDKAVAAFATVLHRVKGECDVCGLAIAPEDERARATIEAAMVEAAQKLWVTLYIENNKGGAPKKTATSSSGQTAQPSAPPCPKCGGPMWDNRPKKATGEFSAKSPDYKCKNKDECGGAIWPDTPQQGGDKVGREVPDEAFSAAALEAPDDPLPF